MTDELPNPHRRMFRTPQEQLDMGQVHTVVKDFDQLVHDRIVKALGISADLLTGVSTDYSGAEYESRAGAYMKAHMERIRQLQTHMPKMELWTCVGYWILWLDRSPRVVLYGPGQFGWVETISRRFSSARKARVWAKKQTSIVLHLTICPGWAQLDPGYDVGFTWMMGPHTEPVFEIETGFASFVKRTDPVIPPAQD